MGGEQSKRMEEIVEILKQYQFRQKGSISEDEFVHDLFSPLDLTKADEKCTPVFISGMHVLKLYYAELSAMNRNNLSRSKAIKAIQTLYEDPKQAIECSYRLMRSANYGNISKEQFSTFFVNCFTQGIDAILKQPQYSADFRNNFKQWINSNMGAVRASAEKMFDENAQSQSNAWTEGDFRRWILNKHHWNIYVQIKGKSYQIPLHILSLFGIRLESNN